MRSSLKHWKEIKTCWVIILIINPFQPVPIRLGPTKMALSCCHFTSSFLFALFWQLSLNISRGEGGEMREMRVDRLSTALLNEDLSTIPPPQAKNSLYKDRPFVTSIPSLFRQLIFNNSELIQIPTTVSSLEWWSAFAGEWFFVLFYIRRSSKGAIEI